MAATGLVKNINEDLIIACMRDGRVRTKQELANETRLSFPTTSKLIDELVEKNVVIDLGLQSKSYGGRRATEFCINDEYAHTLVFFIQDTRVCFFCSVVFVENS